VIRESGSGRTSEREREERKSGRRYRVKAPKYCFG
jgi:hypothetical protein